MPETHGKTEAPQGKIRQKDPSTVAPCSGPLLQEDPGIPLLLDSASTGGCGMGPGPGSHAPSFDPTSPGVDADREGLPTYGTAGNVLAGIDH